MLQNLTHLEPGGGSTELRVVLDHLLIDGSAICISESFLESILKRNIATIIFDIVDHLDSECQANCIHVQALDL